jgi:L-ascorbate metabolism protein UlaG (beta-lactamase superfamily)
MEPLSCTWLGQSFFKFVSPGGKMIYVDPWKDAPPGNNLCPPDTVLDDADIILITHGHLDHMGDIETIAKAGSGKPNLKVVCNFEITMYLLEKGIPGDRIVSMGKGGTVTVEGIRISMVHAVHGSGIGPFGPRTLVNGGEAAGFVIRMENEDTLYHAGDTDLFSDMRLIRERFSPRVAFLPIGDVYTMGPKDAADAVALIEPAIAVPMHYMGTFGLPGTPEAFIGAVNETSGDAVRVVVPKPGETLMV